MQDQPQSAEDYFNLGLNFHLQLEFDVAIKTYEQAIQLDPTYDPPYTNLGLALIETQQLEKAITVFKKVLALPERIETPASIHTLAHYNLAIIRKRQGQIDAARRDVSAALAITPDFPEAQTLQQMLL